jgi:hypothetical protein
VSGDRAPLRLALGLLGLGAIVLLATRGCGAGSAPPEPAEARAPGAAPAPIPATPPPGAIASGRAPDRAALAALHAAAAGDDRPEIDPDLEARAIFEGGSRRALGEAGQARVDELASGYRKRAEYPPWSYVVPAGRDPVAEAATAPKTTALLAGAHKLVVALSSWSLIPDDTLTINASLLDEAERPIAAQGGRAGLLNTATTGYLAHVDLAPDKVGAVAGVWKVPPPEMVSGDPGLHRLQVIVSAPNGDKLEAQTELLITVPGLRLTRRYRDQVVDGNLVIGVEVNATRRVRAHVAALLAPVSILAGDRVYAQAAAFVDPGTSFLALTFHGHALHALGAPGPYRITSLVLQDTSSFPPARLPLEKNPYTTSVYPLSAFDDKPYGQPDLLELADFLETR